MGLLITILKEIAGVPEEFQVLPEGKIEMHGLPPAYLDESAAQAIIAAFERSGHDMVIDYEHQSLTDQPAPAAGWIKKLVYKGKEGLWAVVEWTEKAKQYIKNREYRYFSPVMLARKPDRKIVEVLSIALTNAPRMNNLRPIAGKMSLDEERSAQEERSAKYKIGVKEGGHLTAPSEWASVPEDEFLDPVNYRYPCPDADQTRAAAVYWAREDNEAQYTAEEKGIINNRLEKFRKEYGIGEIKKEVAKMEKLKTMLGLAADAAEEKITETVTLLVNKVRELEGRKVIACKEVLGALGAKEDAGKDDVLQIIAGLRAPADVAVKLSQDVARLSTELAAIKQGDLIQMALKDGKTSPDELDKWGRDLALKSPEQFKLIVLSRPMGCVIPVGSIPAGPAKREAGMDEVQAQVNKLMGVSEEMWKKYNKTT